MYSSDSKQVLNGVHPMMNGFIHHALLISFANFTMKYMAASRSRFVFSHCLCVVQQHKNTEFKRDKIKQVTNATPQFSSQIQILSQSNDLLFAMCAIPQLS